MSFLQYDENEAREKAEGGEERKTNTAKRNGTSNFHYGSNLQMHERDDSGVWTKK